MQCQTGCVRANMLRYTRCIRMIEGMTMQRILSNLGVVELTLLAILIAVVVYAIRQVLQG